MITDHRPTHRDKTYAGKETKEHESGTHNSARIDIHGRERYGHTHKCAYGRPQEWDCPSEAAPQPDMVPLATPELLA